MYSDTETSSYRRHNQGHDPTRDKVAGQQIIYGHESAVQAEHWGSISVPHVDCAERSSKKEESQE
jgi:hypothetical protein